MLAKAANDIAFLGLNNLKRFLIKLAQLIDVHCALGKQVVIQAVVTGLIRKHNSKHTPAH
jgi:hypothetical protein